MASSVKPESSTINSEENISVNLLEQPRHLSSEEVVNNTCKALCVLESPTGSRTWGILCDAKSGDQLIPLLIGTHPSLPISASDDLCNFVLKFPFLETKIENNLTIRNIWCTQYLNAIVVELTSNSAKECRSRGANFLKVGTASVSEEVCI